jgi:cytochrome c oxidase assembly protein subunit 15
MPLVNAPGQVTVSLMLSMVFLGGLVTARYSQKGALAALFAGACSGLLDILILGSLIRDESRGISTVPAILLSVAGSILLNALVGGFGGLVGNLFPAESRGRIQWSQRFALVLAVATLPLITAGGLVTAFHAGLAVPDWPESFGYNMFLFPLSQMQSNHGQFYEHSHRLMGALVGATSLTLAIYVTLTDKRRWIKLLAWSIPVAVGIQGIFGGTRVTERSIALAIIHGVFAQLVFAAMASFAAFTSRTFFTLAPSSRPAASADRFISAVLVACLIIQLMLGAIVRHTDSLIMLHILMASFVALLALTAGFRAWGLHNDLVPLKRTGVVLMLLVLLQLLLGVIALAIRTGPSKIPTPEAALLTTAHQANGALVLATASVLAVWNWRLLLPAPHTATTAPEPTADPALA